MPEKNASRRAFIKSGVAASAALGFPAIVPGTVFGTDYPKKMQNVRVIASESPHKAEEAPFFEIQNELFKSTRIPKIIVAADGSVLAFAPSSKILRRSEDQGKTWSPALEVGPDASGSAVVDETTGDVLVVNGRGTLYRSRDHGKNWIKETVSNVKPNAAGHGIPENLPINLHCSESGITLKGEKHKGRLLMPGRIQPPKGGNDQEYWPYNYNTSMYSDDHGRNWQIGEPVQSGTGEGTLAELSDGRIYYNSRCHMAVDHRRRIAWSYDGGHMWVDWQVSNELYEVGGPHYFKYSPNPSYGCNAGLLRLPDDVTGGKDVLLFSTPDNPGAGDKNCRVRMTVWASFDGAKSWPIKRRVYEGPSAYSSLAADKNGMIYLLFENGEKRCYERISLARFNLNWLAGKQDSTQLHL